MIKRRQARHVRTFLESSKLRKRRRRRKIIRRVTFSVLGLIIVTALIFLFRIPQFQLKNITIEGNQHIAGQEIEQKLRESIATHKPLFGLVQPTSSFFISNDTLEKLLKDSFLRIQDASVHISFFGHMKVKVQERLSFGNWCNDISCFEIDENGLLFDAVSTGTTTNISIMSQVTPSSSTPMFKGLLTENGIGSQFLDKERLSKLKEMGAFLANKKLPTEYIICQEEYVCSIVVQNNQKVIIDLNQDMKLVSERLGVALENKPLKDLMFAYIDTRFGNKLFYKIKGADPIMTDDEVAADENNASTSGTASSTEN